MYPYIQFFGREIGTYGLCMLLGVTLAVVLGISRGRSHGLQFEDVLIVSAFSLGLALISGSLLFVFITYTPEQIWQYICAGELGFLSSGIIFYGGLIGGILGAFVGIRVSGCEFGAVESSAVPFIPLGHAVGRVGCVMAGCCHGFVYEGPFALYYPNSVLGLSPAQSFFPVQPLESLINLVICLFLLWYDNRKRRTFDLLFMYLGLYAIARFFLEMLRGDMIRGIWNVLSTSQIISLVLLGVSVIGRLMNRRRLK